MNPLGNIIVVEGGGFQSYSWHWGGQYILDMLIGGPDLARRHISTFERCTEADWDSPLPFYGGAVIDFDRKRLLFFGDDLMAEVADRRAVLTVLTDVWAGYQVGWAYDAMVELAGYVGGESPPETEDRDLHLRLTRDRYSSCELVSVAGTDGTTKIWPLIPYRAAAWCGPALLDSLPGRGAKKVVLRTIPACGVHVDLPRKTVGVWRTGVTSWSLGGLPQLWRGWRIDFWEDRYEEHVARCGGALRVPVVDFAAGIDNVRTQLRRRVLDVHSDGPVGDAFGLAQALSRAAPGFVASADAVLGWVIRPNEEEWARFVSACDAHLEIYTKSS